MGFMTRLHALGEGVRIAFDAIGQNKARTGLTVLGIAVGVFVVTAMSAAVHGINSGVEASLAAAGPTTFFMSKFPMAINTCTGAADSCPWRHNPPITLDEVHAIAARPEVQAVIAQAGGSASFKYHDRQLPGASYTSYTPGWTDVDGGTISPGRSFTAPENTAGAQVVIINAAMKEQLFGDMPALDKKVLVNNQPFLVIGIYTPLGSLFNSGNTPRAILPMETARRRLNLSTGWMTLVVKPRDGVSQDQAIDAAIATLRIKRALHPATENNFYVTTQDKLLDIYNKIVGVFFLVMIVLSSIGLLVGGVGVVAIMMISVTERTREIGVRKALGATRATILWQFLVEAATLTTIGAVVGLAVGGGLTLLIRTTTPIQASIPPIAVAAALVASALTGVVFGLLPAARAARLDPVEALRYE
ncbi:MAG TPA: ABC transporter permease [Gemmatimonadaceae bacterium]|nr:ABC transporter permease [Gemmatimonadaceae bacterium]